MSGQILSLLAGMVRVAIPISFAALAGMLSERAGVINMGLEGIMLIGSFFAVVGSYVTGSAWMGLLFAALSGILMGLVLVTLTVGFKCEHVLAGVGINIFASGITIVLLEMIWGTKGKSGMVAGLGMLRVPLISKIPVIGDIIGTISPLFYILVLCVFLLWFLLYRTPAGLRILVIGENHGSQRIQNAVPLRHGQRHACRHRRSLPVYRGYQHVQQGYGIRKRLYRPVHGDTR